MRQFQFKLEKILRLRKYDEKKCEARLGEVVSECNAVSRKIRVIEEKRLTSFRNFKLELGGIEYLKNYELFFSKLEADKNNLSERLSVLNKKKETLQEEYLQASQARKVIEKLKERRSQQYYREENIAEINEIDDMNTRAASNSGSLVAE